MAQDRFNISRSFSEITEESRYLFVTEEPEILRPDELRRTVYENNIMDHSRALDLEVRVLRTEMSAYKKQGKDLYKLLGQWRELNSKLEVKEQEQRTEIARLWESVCEIPVLKEELAQTEKKQAENENLWAEIDALQENERVINERNKNLTDEVERNQREIEHLTAAVRDLQCQVKVAQEEHSDKDEITQKLSHVESLLEEKQAEITKLRTALHDLQEKEEFLNEQNDIVTADLAQLESLRKKKIEEIKNLKETVQDLQYQVEDAEQQILTKDEQITKLNMEIGYKQETIEEWCTLTAEMRQSIRDLKDQLAMKQEEDILDGTQNFREESRACAEHTELEIFEEARDQTLQDTPSAEPQQLEVPSTKPQWHCCAKWLLKAGLHIGISTVGVLIPAAILTAKVTANCCTDPNYWQCVYHLLEPYCNIQQVHHPF
ncbi:putative WEB family protein At1g65010, chloroplastic isoform X3 [Lates japonicus]|uniref:WEB family protein At1g65010, chloroplastic isoform X3 n=1 Tax=Lates japonicus TaxID=270547 RepID=A0AAD3MVY4_LATJO|nr:putative WEB family protein At1g65010, chloroplastic isoform X3 [Lates japonicus]